MTAYDVIFVDDEVSLVEIVQHYVLANYKKWRFMAFSNSQMLYQEITKNQLSSSVWIVDMMMPGKNGAQIAQAIRSVHGENSVILAYTALDRQELSQNEHYRDGLQYFNHIMNKKEDLTGLLSFADMWVVKE
jgi:DNA-binding response OmpR family regulator